MDEKHEGMGSNGASGWTLLGIEPAVVWFVEESDRIMM